MHQPSIVSTFLINFIYSFWDYDFLCTTISSIADPVNRPSLTDLLNIQATLMYMSTQV
jgi:hypothetical protein